tara:strand:+ start:1962 stop:2618 length:657 start_codon:yes stop_codon:yes gene_type:complete
MRQLAKAISWIFLPLFMPIYGLLLTLYIPSQEFDISKPSMFEIAEGLKAQILFLFLVFVTIAPGVSFILMYKRGLLSSVEMEERKERLFPLFIMLSYCILLFFLFWKKAPNHFLPLYIYILPLTGAIVALMCMILTSRFKISLHAAGAGIFVGYLCAFASNQIEFHIVLIPIGILISGLILSARLYLDKHSPKEVYLGWGLTFTASYLTLKYIPLILL